MDAEVPLGTTGIKPASASQGGGPALQTLPIQSEAASATDGPAPRPTGLVCPRCRTGVFEGDLACRSCTLSFVPPRISDAEPPAIAQPVIISVAPDVVATQVTTPTPESGMGWVVRDQKAAIPYVPEGMEAPTPTLPNDAIPAGPAGNGAESPNARPSEAEAAAATGAKTTADAEAALLSEEHPRSRKLLMVLAVLLLGAGSAGIMLSGNKAGAPAAANHPPTSAPPSAVPAAASLTLTTPLQIGPLPLLHSVATDGQVAQAQTLLSSQSGMTKSAVGMYGTANSSLMFMSIQGKLASTAQSQMAGSISTVASAQGLTLAPNLSVPTTIAGITYTCYPMTGGPANAGGAACTWSKGDIVGAVAGLSGIDLSTALSDAQAAQAASES